MGQPDDGSADWALREAERAVRAAEARLRAAANRVFSPAVMSGRWPIHRAGRLVATADMLGEAARQVRRIRTWARDKQ